MITGRFKIGDFSQLGRVSVRTLRLYDELGLFKPAATDQWSGYRYYTLDQLPRLNRILALKDLGLSLEQIAQLLKNDLSAKQMREMLAQKQGELEVQLVETRKQMQRVQARLHQIENEGAPPAYEVALKPVDPTTIASVRVVVPHIDQMGDMRIERVTSFYQTLARHQIKPVDPELFIYHIAEYHDENIDTEMGSTVDASVLKKYPRGVGEVTFRELARETSVASVIHHGNIWGIPDAMTALYAWVGRNGLQSAGPYRELHHGWRECTTPPEILFHSITLEIQLPVAPLNS